MHTWTLDKPDNLIDWWEESVAQFVDRRLFGTKNKNGIYEWVTFKEVDVRINNLRAGLAQLGINNGVVVGIIANNRVNGLLPLLPPGGASHALLPCMKRSWSRYGNTSLTTAR